MEEFKDTANHSFQVANKLYVGDPSYGLRYLNREPALIKILDAKPGTWLGYAKTVQVRTNRTYVMSLWAHHQDENPNMAVGKLRLEAMLPVDSGRMAILDAQALENNDNFELGRRPQKESRLLQPLPFGVVSSSGLGDSQYQLQVTRDENGRAVLVRVEFLNMMDVRAGL